MTEFEQIYRAYFNDVFRYIRRLSGDEGIAEEITGETFFKAMRALNSFRGDCDIRVWLCQIAKNCYYSYLKKTKRVDSIEDTELLNIPSSAESIEDRLVRQDEAEQIRNILHDVPEPYKEVFMWRVFAQFSFKQIGQLFGKTENWACVTYHRAKNLIKTRLEEINDE